MTDENTAEDTKEKAEYSYQEYREMGLRMAQEDMKYAAENRNKKNTDKENAR